MAQTTIELYPILTDLDSFLNVIYDHYGMNWPQIPGSRVVLMLRIPTERGKLPVLMQRWPDARQEGQYLVNGKFAWLHIHFGEQFPPYRQVFDMSVTAIARERLKIELRCYMADDYAIAGYVNMLVDKLYKYYPEAEKSMKQNVDELSREQYFKDITVCSGTGLEELNWTSISANLEQFKKWADDWGTQHQLSYVPQEYHRVLIDDMQRLHLEHLVIRDEVAGSIVFSVEPCLDLLSICAYMRTADSLQSDKTGLASAILRIYFNEMWAAILDESSFRPQYDSRTPNVSQANYTRLSGYEVDQLKSALIEAYDCDSLRIMVRTQLDKSLGVIAGSGKLEVIVFDLIDWAERTGNVGALVAGALSGNPNNADLQAVHKALLGNR